MRQHKIKFHLFIDLTIILVAVSSINLVFAQRYTDDTRPLLMIAQATSAEIQSWRESGDKYRQAGKITEALDAYRHVEKIGGGSEDLTLEIAKTYQQGGYESEAYWEYRKLRNSNDEATRATVCRALNKLRYARSKVLPWPYFADLNVNGGWQSIGDTAFIDAKTRLGLTQGETRWAQYYLFGSYTRDNRSGRVGLYSPAYFDNVAIAGVGLQKRLFTHYNLSLIGEYGRAWDLIDYGREKARWDTRGGFEFYHDIGTEFDCDSEDKYPNRFIFSMWSRLFYFSRYDHAVIFNLDLRPGIRVYETLETSLDTFVLLSVNANLKEDFQYGELGVGVTWVPDREYDFRTTARASQIYFDNGENRFNFIVDFEYYGLW